jgi:hypothetical protein
MSLDIYLHNHKESSRLSVCDECGHQHECIYNETIYHGNLTHNLVDMADAAGLYQCLWRPNENDIFIAEDIIPHLEKALPILLQFPDKFIALQPTNGWGTYEQLVEVVQGYLSKCIHHSQSIISVCR